MIYVIDKKMVRIISRFTTRRCVVSIVTIAIIIFVMRYFVADWDSEMGPPTLYEYYTSEVRKTGLETTPDVFKLNGRNITILSGAIHYFRVHPKYWQDRLRKLRACGLNTVETYVPWNLHEPEKDKFDFGYEDNDMSMFLDLVKYIEIAQEEDLFVILRPGPYICAEWDFGGLPSWLLRTPNIKVRTSDPNFTQRVKIYYDQLLPKIESLQFTNGGPIIAFQVENEYGSVEEGGLPVDTEYLEFVKHVMESNGLVELFFTSDSPKIHRDAGSLPGVLQTANFQQDPEAELGMLKDLQPNKPLMVMEFWTGWFDHWMEPFHHTIPPSVYGNVLEQILLLKSSVNLYMFHGGTNFGFMNGANIREDFPQYVPDVSSYDYDAPLSEAGDYTDKYYLTKKMFAEYNPVVTRLPEQPKESQKVKYSQVRITGFLRFEDIINRVSKEDRVLIDNVISMEELNINNNNGQSYGYIVYRKRMNLNENSILKISGHVRDTAMILVDAVQKTEPLLKMSDLNEFGYWVQRNAEFHFDPASAGDRTVDILVENLGRNNFGKLYQFNQKKGLWQGPVLLDGAPLNNWEAIALQFKSKWVRSLTGWRSVERDTSTSGPVLLRAILNIGDSPRDTFLDMSKWHKGIVFVNGFNIGRYFSAGPPRTLYVPAPLLRSGQNEIIIFEHFSRTADTTYVTFSDTPILG